MRIEEELKLDYSDVLFRPKRSTLSSRKDVDLNRTYKFKYSRNEWSGIPIMAANMDGVGELGIADALSANEMVTCLTKQHDVKKLSKYKNLKKNYKNIALSIGTFLTKALPKNFATPPICLFFNASLYDCVAVPFAFILGFAS